MISATRKGAHINQTPQEVPPDKRGNS